MSATSFAVSFLYFICLNSSILLSKTTAENRLPPSVNDNISLLTNTESKTKTEVVSVKLMQRLKESLQLARLLAPTRHSNDFVVDNGDSEAESNVLDAYWESNWRSENGSNEFELSNRVEADAEVDFIVIVLIDDFIYNIRLTHLVVKKCADKVFRDAKLFHKTLKDLRLGSWRIF